MCGIAGIIDFSGAPIPNPDIRKMADAIAHRGPDGEGFWQEDGIAFAHRRLAILDPTEAANQPVYSPDGRYVMVYNGEIYNFWDLRRDLEAKGCQFKTDCDAEVLLAGFVEYGSDVFLKLNGMFALAIFDRKQKSLTLARDRFGVKPLYYAVQNGVLTFASEAKAILAHPKTESRLNVEGLAEYLTFMNFISDQTLFSTVRLFPAGQYISIPIERMLENNHKFNANTFWDFNFTGDNSEFDQDALADQLGETFKQAVKRQLLSDVGVSSFLSGGIDSGAITAIAASQTKNLRTFTAGFDTSTAGHDRGYDERAAAELMAKAFRTRHFEVFIKSDDFERCLQPLCYHLDEPRVGQSYPNYLASELASKFEKVVLSGCGGDELFGGYPWRYFHGLPASSFDEFVDGSYAYWHRLEKDDAGVIQLLSPVAGQLSGFNGRDIFTSIFPKEARQAKTTEQFLNWALYFEAKTFMNGLLLVEDKVSMAHGLETRVPFLDNDMVDLACEMPIQAKLADIRGWENQQATAQQVRRTDGKAILRHMVSRFVPEEIYNREKQGFSAPDASWFRNESYDFIRDSLLGGHRNLHNIIEKKTIEDVLAKHKTGEQDGRLKIWSFLNLGEVMQNYNL